MFWPQPMREVSFFVLESDLEPVLEVLARRASFELEESRLEDWAPAGEFAGLAATYRSLAQRLEALRRALELPIEGGAPEAKLSPGNDHRWLEPEVAVLEGRVREWQERRLVAARQLERLQAGEAQLAALEAVDLPLDDLGAMEGLQVSLGRLPEENLPRVAEALFRIPFVLVPVRVLHGQAIVLAACPGEHAAVMSRALMSAFFESTEFPDGARGRPAEARRALARPIAEATRRLEQIDREGRVVAAEIQPRVARLWRQATADAQLGEALRVLPRHGTIYLLSGWVPAGRLAALRGGVQVAAGGRVVVEELTAGNSRAGVPTLLSTPAWLRPFQTLVTTYGLPAYGEMDPTLIATASFLLMYGMMFGDLGQGLILALAGLVIRWRGVPFGIVIAAAGLVAAVFGLLYGTVLGMGVLPTLWLRPMRDVTSLLLSAVVAGVVLLNLGYALNLVSSWRVRDWPRLLLDKSGLVGILLYWSLLGGGLLVLRGLVPLTAALAPAACMALVLWWREPLARRLWPARGGSREGLVTGFFELFEALLGYLSNSLSFVRLGAFAVAHEGLSHLVVQYARGPVAPVVWLLGTLFIVGFEGLIVGIQALRLEYYEFFGRFFHGTGRPFRPLSLGRVQE